MEISSTLTVNNAELKVLFLALDREVKYRRAQLAKPQSEYSLRVNAIQFKASEKMQEKIMHYLYPKIDESVDLTN